MLAALPVATEGLFKHHDAVALVGPTGAGKTATIGKLAAAFVLNGKAQDLAIISTDAYRIGAQDQLRTLCDILGVPLTMVDDHLSLRRALERYSGRRKVLVDTAGLTQQDDAWRLQLKELESCCQKVANYMVVSTTNQLAVHVKALQEYASLPLAGCILTKLDECGRLGDSLSAVIQAQLPIAFTTSGMRIPEDLDCADGLKLIKQSLAGSLGDACDPVLAQSCFQELLNEGDGEVQEPSESAHDFTVRAEQMVGRQNKDINSLLKVCGL
jgi:flagellar biosynthesis protein FlhF